MEQLWTPFFLVPLNLPLNSLASHLLCCVSDLQTLKYLLQVDRIKSKSSTIRRQWYWNILRPFPQSWLGKQSPRNSLSTLSLNVNEQALLMLKIFVANNYGKIDGLMYYLDLYKKSLLSPTLDRLGDFRLGHSFIVA